VEKIRWRKGGCRSGRFPLGFGCQGESPGELKRVSTKEEDYGNRGVTVWGDPESRVKKRGSPTGKTGGKKSVGSKVILSNFKSEGSPKRSRRGGTVLNRRGGKKVL